MNKEINKRGDGRLCHAHPSSPGSVHHYFASYLPKGSELNKEGPELILILLVLIIKGRL